MKTGKTNKIFGILVLLILFATISTFFMGSFMSKFVTGSNDNSQTITWEINGKKVTMNLFNTEYLINKGQKIISPGASSELMFNIMKYNKNINYKAAYQVTIDFNDVLVSDKIKNNTSIQWKLDDGEWSSWEDFKTDILSLSGNNTGKHIYKPDEFFEAFKNTEIHRISWQWVMDNNNNADTFIGNDILIDDIRAIVDVSITAEEIVN